MKVVILAGGFGTRLSEETHLKPKPMVEIGGRPILWHIMQYFAGFGHNDFVVCCGYKGYLIKEYFYNYFLHSSDVTIKTSSGEVEIHKKTKEDWTVTLVDTGANSMTGGRLRRVKSYLDSDEPFFFTYGDGVSDVNLDELSVFNASHGRLATVTAVSPPGRYGALEIEQDQVRRFKEKPAGDGALINGGYFVLQPGCLEYISGDDTVWEQEPLTRLAADSQLMAFQHAGFWQPMDTLREKNILEELVVSSKAPWLPR